MAEYACGPERTSPVPDRLPRLQPGTHVPADESMNVLEAASWLGGDEWGEQPRSVHPAIVLVMRGVVTYPDDATGELWPLLLASVGTASRHPRPVLRLRGAHAHAKVRRNPGRSADAWRALVHRRVAALSSGPHGPKRRRLSVALARLGRLSGPGPRQDRGVWIDTFSS